MYWKTTLEPIAYPDRWYSLITSLIYPNNIGWKSALSIQKESWPSTLAEQGHYAIKLHLELINIGWKQDCACKMALKTSIQWLLNFTGSCEKKLWHDESGTVVSHVDWSSFGGEIASWGTNLFSKASKCIGRPLWNQLLILTVDIVW